MKSQRRNKSLEALARSVKDSDQFVTHICNIAAAYGKHHALDAAAGRDMRQALRTFSKHAQALSLWLKSAARSSSSEGLALRQMGLVARNPSSPGQSMAMRSWLVQAADASSVAADAPASSARDEALRSAAEGLRATFERHGIKLAQRAPQQKQSDAVRLLCALVSAGGEEQLDPAEAKRWLKSPLAPPASGRQPQSKRQRGAKRSA